MKTIIKILSTKTIAKDLVQQAKANDISVDEINFIEIKPVKDLSVLDKIRHYSNEKIVAIFTSTNAVEAVFTNMDFKPDWKIFCTSGATKELLLNNVNADVIIDTANNASSLADKILMNSEIISCVFFCGNQRLNSLPDKLLKQGRNLDEVIVYESIASPQKTAEFYNGILFFSPSAVESFFSVNTIDDQTVLFSIGKTTTKALRKFANNKIVTAVFPSSESVLKEVKVFDFENE